MEDVSDDDECVLNGDYGEFLVLKVFQVPAYKDVRVAGYLECWFCLWELKETCKSEREGP